MGSLLLINECFKYKGERGKYKVESTKYKGERGKYKGESIKGKVQSIKGKGERGKYKGESTKGKGEIISSLQPILPDRLSATKHLLDSLIPLL